MGRKSNERIYHTLAGAIRQLISLSVIVFFLGFGFTTDAQDSLRYFIQFTDKANSPYSISNPEEFLTQRAIERRARQYIPIDHLDIPVNQAYVDSIRNYGFRVLHRSRWFNGVTVGTIDTNLIKTVGSISFVRDSRNIENKPLASSNEKLEFTGEIIEPRMNKVINDYGPSFNQIGMLNGDIIHDMGYQGEGMVIAVIDAGFLYVDQLQTFARLRDEGRLLGGKDFVVPGTTYLDDHTHGTYVLSTMAGYLPGLLVGTAPEASYWLLRSEEGASEYLIEEYNWVAAAEFADSVGADVVNTSLGYTTFDDSTMNHVPADLDGNTTPIARGADIAASKGMLMVNSAGNWGSDPSWRYLGSAADGDSILAVAAVDSLGIPASFSSRGRSADPRVKPNVAAQGVQSVITLLTDDGVRTGNGTSFSGPIMAGMAACLWQTNPDKTNMEVFHAIERSASQYNNPDTVLGYGIPDFAKAKYLLDGFEPGDLDESGAPTVYPNPFDGAFTFFVKSKFTGRGTLTLYNSLGKAVHEQFIDVVAGSYYNGIIRLRPELQNGVYLLKWELGNQSHTLKVIKGD